eukprot:TRINITY_DN1558_c0_g1_i2.p1 TRINITY_DN1558_c0_g1~~TRINITY_DN1558_c0_g1_i2.p1  ORF type:complete len:502 (-),score=149.39 TRINITY_DN1558_c0_g1_i2:183-1688(-)
MCIRPFICICPFILFHSCPLHPLFTQHTTLTCPDFLAAGCHVTVLFADLHAYLDNMKAPWELLAQRVKYYEAIIKSTLRSLGVPLDKLKFVQGTEYQLSREYTLDMYKLSSLVGENDFKRAGAEVVKQVSNPLLSGLLYPGLQALDEEYLKVDAQFGGVDQRKIFIFAEEQLPKLGYKQRIHLMNPMVPGLAGPKMSSSDPNSKIDLLDSPATVKKKVAAAFCEEGNVEEGQNGLLSFLKFVFFPIQIMKGKNEFVINRDEKYGGPIKFSSYDEVHQAFADRKVFPADLKLGVVDALNSLLAPIRKDFETPEMQKLIAAAYPEKANAGGKKGDGRGKDWSRLNVVVGEITTSETDGNVVITKVRVGEGDERQVVFAPARMPKAPENPVGQHVIVLINDKPGKVKGHESTGTILLGAENWRQKDPNPQFVQAPAGSQVGERVIVEGFDDEPDEQLKPNLKIFAHVCKSLTINANKEACYNDKPLKTAQGNCTLADLTTGSIA